MLIKGVVQIAPRFDGMLIDQFGVIHDGQKLYDGTLRVLTELKKQREPGKFLGAFEPRNPHYQALKKMMKVYTLVSEQETWPVIPQGAATKPGQSDPRIPAIRQLLGFTGDFEWNVTSSAAYDQNLAIAVQRFQKRHGLEAKGVLEIGRAHV